MKIYTKTGDNGSSGLYGGQRLPKNHARFEASGTIDELNAQLGYALSLLTAAAPNCDPTVKQLLQQTQYYLFDIGAHLATPYAAEAIPANLPKLPTTMVSELEQSIDKLAAVLPPLENFILPTGTPLASALHVARTVCRRAERTVVALAVTDNVAPVQLQYLNRLSDWLFMVARYFNHLAGQPESLWRE